MHQWMELMEERNAVAVPQAESHIPGSPAEGWTPPQGMEPNVPLLYLAMDSAKLGVIDQSERVVGVNTTLVGERHEEMVPLVVLEKGFVCGNGGQVRAICAWDSSIHACPALNRAPQGSKKVG